MTKLLIVGATSAIATSTARRFAQKGAHLYLLARSAERLATLTSDLKIRGAVAVDSATFDANDLASHESKINTAVESLGGIDAVLIAYGTLGDQKACEADFARAMQELSTNLISVLSLLTTLANILERQRSGVIAVLSSVAGDRGRQSNYVYGTSKGGLSIFLQGLRNRLYRSGVHVITIKPGFVDTPMTASFKKGLLWAKPNAIASGIDKAIAARSSVVYLPFFWRYIMWIIRSIPESIFRRLSL
jgi:decaprenylphospho-beta-D-erythro-pentofuranosid-2-ulose 2-reductase